MKRLLLTFSIFVLSIAFMGNSMGETSSGFIAVGSTFMVYPSGDLSGATDAANIIAAFDQATAAGDGSTVELTAGTFHINQTIEPWDFVGTFKGAGKKATTIKVTPTGFMNNGLVPFCTPFAFYLKDRGASLEDKVNLTIEGMTLVITGEAPDYYLEDDDEPQQWWHGIFIDARYRVLELSSGEIVIEALPAFRDVTISDMAFIGDGAVDPVADPLFIAGGQGGIVVGNRFHRNFLYGRNTGSIRVLDADFVTDDGWSKLAIWDQLDSIVTVERVHIVGSGNIGAWISGNSNTTVDVSRLEATGCPGVAFVSNPSSTLSVTHSDIDRPADANWAAIEIWDDDGTNDVLISHNKIHDEDNWLWGAIFIEGVQDGVITNNSISGRGPAAMYLGVLEWWPGSFTLLGNNLQNWETTGPNPWGFWAAPIWLGPYVTDSTVVGANNKWNIFDEPEYDYLYPDWWNYPLYDENWNPLTYDENWNIVPKNNVFTGVNNMHVHIGQDVRDAMQQKVEAKRLMRAR